MGCAEGAEKRAIRVGREVAQGRAMKKYQGMGTRRLEMGPRAGGSATQGGGMFATQGGGMF